MVARNLDGVSDRKIKCSRKIVRKLVVVDGLRKCVEIVGNVNVIKTIVTQRGGCGRVGRGGRGSRCHFESDEPFWIRMWGDYVVDAR